jgi:hypothetical protein
MAIDFDNVEQTIIDTIRLEDPDIDLREGTAFRDLLVKALTVVLQPFGDEIQEIQLEQSILNADLISEDAMDALVANLFVSRRQGSKATGTVKLFFSDAQPANVAAGTVFRSSAGLEFQTLQDFSITREGMLNNADGSLFFMEVVVFSREAGSEENVEAGDIVEIVGGPSGVVSVSNDLPFSRGVERESNVDLAERTRLAISVRDLNTEPSIRFIILENFNTVQDVQPVGFGDPEMIRDVLTGTGLSLGDLELGSVNQVNIGGKTDIYIKTFSLLSRTAVASNIQPIIHLRDFESGVDSTPGAETYVSISRPVIILDSIEILDPLSFAPTGETLVEGTDFTYASLKPTLTFSASEDIVLVLTSPTEHVGKTIRINYRTAPEVSTIQNFVESTSNRITNADLLVKYALPCVISGNVNYRADPSLTDIDDTVRFILESGFNTVLFSDTLEISDTVALLYDAGASFVESPLTFTASCRQVDGSIVETEIVNTFSVGRTAALIAGDEDELVITRLA